jgi:hypothetical protein
MRGIQITGVRKNEKKQWACAIPLLRGVEGCVLCTILLRCCMATNTPLPPHNPTRPLSRGDKKNLPNTYEYKSPAINQQFFPVKFVLPDNRNITRKHLAVKICIDDIIIDANRQCPAIISAVKSFRVTQ